MFSHIVDLVMFSENSQLLSDLSGKYFICD